MKKRKKRDRRTLLQRVVDAAETLAILQKAAENNLKPYHNQNLLDSMDYERHLFRDIGILQAARGLLIEDVRVLCVVKRLEKNSSKAKLKGKA